MDLVKKILQWYVGISFILLGIAMLFLFVPSGIIAMGIGLFILPPSIYKIEAIVKKKFSLREKMLVIIFGFILFLITLFVYFIYEKYTPQLTRDYNIIEERTISTDTAISKLKNDTLLPIKPPAKLNVAEKKQIWHDCAKADDKAMKEANKMYPGISFEDAKNNTRHYDRILLHNQKHVANKYKITLEELYKIQLEGFEKGWPMPSFE